MTMNASPAGTPPLLRPVSGMAKAVTVVLGLWCVVAAVNILAYANVLRIMDAVLRGVAVPEQEVVDFETFTNAALFAYAAVYVAAAVTFIVWLFRARANADALGPLEHRRSKPWLILGWAVPIVNLRFPYQIVDDIARASDPATRDHDDRFEAHGVKLRAGGPASSSSWHWRRSATASCRRRRQPSPRSGTPST